MNIKLRILLASLLTTTMAFAGDGTGGAGDYGGVSITHSTSPHNLSANANSAAAAEDNGEVCVYCHTPHAANISFTGAPIWNKKTLTTTFNMYAGTVANGIGSGGVIDATPNSPSLACLSCHDGVSGVDSIVNAPGSGMGGEVDNTTNINAILSGGAGPNAGAYGGNIGGTLGVTTGGNADLTNDHPVSISYTGTGLASSPASLRAQGDTLPVGGYGDVWVTPGGGTTVASLLRNSKVECSSCHDPHNATGVSQATSKQVNYLRHSNVNSELCFGCHDK